MKGSSRIKQVLSVAVVSVLAATVMPSTASANGEYYDYDDNVVTVEVDLGDGGGGDTGCVGISTLELPDNTLRARFDELELGIADPSVTIIEYLNWAVGDEYYGGYFYEADLEEYLNDLDEWLGDYTYTLNPEDASRDTLISISYQVNRGFGNEYLAEDTNQDGLIDATDAPDYQTVTRRSYVSDSFRVSFDANDCIDSDDLGLLRAARGFVMRSVDDGDTWETADIDTEGTTSSINRGGAHLRLQTSLLGGLTSIPREITTLCCVEVLEDGEIGGLYPEHYSPISFGDSGQPQMRAVLNVFGPNPTGRYQTKFYYLLEVGDEEYFDGLYWFDEPLFDDYFDLNG